jgi:hypothetical protein
MLTITLSVTNINQGTQTADGSGTLTVHDADGDTLSANINGVFTGSPAGAIFFNGTLSGATLTDGGTPDSTWDGPQGGSFERDLGPPGTYTGFIIQLTLDPGGFLSVNFGGESTEVSGELIPAPAALAALGLGILTFGRRRRH